jgi:hypothetical protein
MPASWPLEIRRAAQVICDGDHTDADVALIAQHFERQPGPASASDGRAVSRRHLLSRRLLRTVSRHRSRPLSWPTPATP